MTRISTLFIFIFSLNLFAQSVVFDNVVSIQGDGVDDSDVTVISTDNSTTSLDCSEQDSIPLRFFHQLLFKNKGSKLDIYQDIDSSSIRIRGDRIIGNCKKMIKWTLKSHTDDENFYLKATFDKSNCDDSTKKCTYQVIRKSNYVSGKYEPSLNGFLQCLEDAEILKKNTGGKYVLHNDAKKNISYRELDEKISNVPNRTGNLYFVSTGEEAQASGAVYKKVEGVRENTCDYVEELSKNGQKLYSKADSDHNEKYLKFQQMCKETDYKKIVSSLSELVKFEDELIKIAEKQIKVEVKKVASEILTVEDKDALDDINLEVLDDFQRYVVYPLEKKIEEKFKEWSNEKDASKKKALEKELTALKEDLVKLGKSPYLSSDVYKKLLKNGKFPEAKNVYLSLKSISEFKKVGKKDGKTFKPSQAWDNIKEARIAYEEKEEDYIVKYERKNCIRTGDADSYARSIKVVNLKLKVLAKNYQSYFKEVSKSKQKSCSKYWVDKASCMRKFLECEFKLKKEYYKKREELSKRLSKYKAEGKIAYNDEKACKESEDDDSDDDDDDVDLKPTKFDFSWANTGSERTETNWANNLNFSANNNWSTNSGWNNNGFNWNRGFTKSFNIPTGINFNLGGNLGNNYYGNNFGNNYFGYNTGFNTNTGFNWGNTSNNWSNFGSTPSTSWINNSGNGNWSNFGNNNGNWNTGNFSPWGTTTGVNTGNFMLGTQGGARAPSSNGLFNF